jgi:corrinoid protein of di/trimethylamine methyltransferase
MDLRGIYDAVLRGDETSVGALVGQAVAEGATPQQIITESLVPAMAEVGARFERAEFFVPEMLVASRAMQAGLRVLRPLMVGEQSTTVGRVVMGTVQGDVHDLGKNLVSTMLEGAGFEIVDLGADVAPETFVETLRQAKADIVGLSALMTTTMPAMEMTVKALAEADLLRGVAVLVGGAPLTQEYCDQIGAQGYAPDASAAVRKASELVGAG